MSVKLVFLGTGSGKPTPQRGVSSVALFRDGDLLMFDCGEGTQVQLGRSTLRPGTLSTVFLTHFHGDHVNGLPGLLGSFTLNSRTEPIDIIGPPGLELWFETMRELYNRDPRPPEDVPAEPEERESLMARRWR